MPYVQRQLLRSPINLKKTNNNVISKMSGTKSVSAFNRIALRVAKLLANMSLKMKLTYLTLTYMHLNPASTWLRRIDLDMTLFPRFVSEIKIVSALPRFASIVEPREFSVSPTKLTLLLLE